MALVLDNLGIRKFSEGAADEIVRVNLIDNTTSKNVLATFKAVSWGTGDATGVDITSSIDFTISAGDTVGGVVVDDGSFILAYADFSTTYSFPDGGVFTLDGLKVTVQ